MWYFLVIELCPSSTLLTKVKSEVLGWYPPCSALKCRKSLRVNNSLEVSRHQVGEEECAERTMALERPRKDKSRGKMLLKRVSWNWKKIYGGMERCMQRRGTRDRMP